MSVLCPVCTPDNGEERVENCIACHGKIWILRNEPCRACGSEMIDQPLTGSIECKQCGWPHTYLPQSIVVELIHGPAIPVN